MKWELKNIRNLEDLKQLKNSFYSQGGEFESLKNEIKTTNNPDRKREIGLKIKEIKERAEAFFLKAQEHLKQISINEILQQKPVDVSLPTKTFGSFHPVNIVKDRFRTWLLNNGFFEMKDSEITTVMYNFELLNIPSTHPARDEHDSLFFDKNRLLRTHNTGISALALERYKDQEFAQFSIGKVFRNDTEDQTHTHQFHQVDILAVGEGIGLDNLLWTLTELLSYVLEREVKIRVRPSFFPFTSPSLEVDILLDGRWVEILGSGMIHPEVFRLSGWENKKMRAFAAGIGIERIAMIKYKINDIREFTTNDLRFLNQFKGESL